MKISINCQFYFLVAGDVTGGHVGNSTRQHCSMRFQRLTDARQEVLNRVTCTAKGRL